MRMEFFNKEYQQSKIQSAPHSPKTEIKCRPQAPELKTRARVDFSRRERLLSSWIINRFLKEILITVC